MPSADPHDWQLSGISGCLMIAARDIANLRGGREDSLEVVKVRHGQTWDFGSAFFDDLEHR